MCCSYQGHVRRFRQVIKPIQSRRGSFNQSSVLPYRSNPCSSARPPQCLTTGANGFIGGRSSFPYSRPRQQQLFLPPRSFHAAGLQVMKSGLASYGSDVRTAAGQSLRSATEVPRFHSRLVSGYCAEPSAKENFLVPPTLGSTPNRRSYMKKTLILAAVALLVGSSASFAGSTRGASGVAPGTQMNNATTPTSRGASEFSPGDKMNDSRTTGMSKGASELSPGDRMNDARKKK
jgi:hypothetical protein